MSLPSPSDLVDMVVDFFDGLVANNYLFYGLIAIVAIVIYVWVKS